MENENQKSYKKKSVPLIILILIFIILVILALVYYFFFMNIGSNYVVPISQNNSVQKVKFADTADFQYSHLISTDNYDTSTQSALAGFKVARSVLSDGTQQINLTAQNTEYQNQSYTVKPGEMLYFIDRFPADDQGTNENNITDDTAVLVDATGYIIQ